EAALPCPTLPQCQELAGTGSWHWHSCPTNVVGIVGQDTILPCTISSTKPLDNPKVQWKKITDGHTEDIYIYGQFGGEPRQKYPGRTSVPGDGFATGNVSLTLKNVQPADEGIYSCIVISRDWSADTATKLSIAGGRDSLGWVGEGERFGLDCRSHGWFPEPTVQWVTEDGQELPAATEIHQDSEKLFSVQSQVTVTGEQVRKVTCQILNPLLQVEKKTTVLISGESHHPDKSLLEAHCLRSPVRPIPVPGRVTTLQSSQTHPRQYHTSPQVRQNHCPSSVIRACVFCSSWPDLIIAEFVTLDSDTAHPRLEVSADGSRVKDTGVIRFLLSNEKRFDSHLFVLAEKGYTTGKHYWEVNVGTRTNWAVGIALESVTRKGTLTLTPQNGFWIIMCADGQDYWAYTNPWTCLTVTGSLSKIGIFLDIPAKQVSFYNVSKRAALYTFSIANGSSQEGKFIPLFSTGLAVAEPDTEALEIVEATVFQCFPLPRILSLAPLGRASFRC
uniref:BT1A1 protein n=1 Tax=Malurus cyaneus samueli TaxID=2593467 RepID=A0A8C5X993_9PASS